MMFCVLRWTWSFVFIFVFVFVFVCIYMLCFSAATDFFSVNKDLYNSTQGRITAAYGSSFNRIRQVVHPI